MSTDTPSSAVQRLIAHVATRHAEGDMTITQGPTLTNPAALKDPDELRAALAHANGELVARTAELHAMKSVTAQLAKTLSDLVVAFLAGDAERIADILANTVKHHVVIKDGAQPTH